MKLLHVMAGFLVAVTATGCTVRDVAASRITAAAGRSAVLRACRCAAPLPRGQATVVAGNRFGPSPPWPPAGAPGCPRRAVRRGRQPVAGIALALLVWDSGGGQLDDDTRGAGIYLLFACTALASPPRRLVAGYVVWTERVAAATLALGAALVTTMTMAVLSVFPTAIAMCGPDDAAFCVGRYWRQLGAMSLAVPNMLAVPRTLVATCLAITIVMTVRHIVHRFQEVHVSGTAVTPEPDQPGLPGSRRSPTRTARTQARGRWSNGDSWTRLSCLCRAGNL